MPQKVEETTVFLQFIAYMLLQIKTNHYFVVRGDIVHFYIINLTTCTFLTHQLTINFCIIKQDFFIASYILLSFDFTSQSTFTFNIPVTLVILLVEVLNCTLNDNIFGSAYRFHNLTLAPESTKSFPKILIQIFKFAQFALLTQLCNETGN